jgi:hypothetical protein
MAPIGHVFRRRPQPVLELPLSPDDVLAIFAALSDIKAWTHDVLRILEGDDDEEEVEP